MAFGGTKPAVFPWSPSELAAKQSALTAQRQLESNIQQRHKITNALLGPLTDLLKPGPGVQIGPIGFQPGVPLGYGQPTSTPGQPGTPGQPTTTPGQPGTPGQPTNQPGQQGGWPPLVPGVPFTPQQNREEYQRLTGLNFGQGAMDAYRSRERIGHGMGATGPSALMKEMEALLPAEQRAREAIAAEGTRRGLGAQEQLLQALGLQINERLGIGQLQQQQLGHLAGISNALVGLMG
jgi:hypothetical protein